MLSRTQVINNGLQIIGAQRIDDPTEGSESARQAASVYDQTVREELAKQAWFFAKTQVRLAAAADAPTFRFERAFTLPSDFIRLVELENRWVFNVLRYVDDDPRPPYELQGRNLLADMTAPLGITYIRDLSDDPTIWSPVFSAVVSAALALKLAMTLTKSDGMVTLAGKRYAQDMREAKRTNAIQQPPAQIPDGSWMLARFA